MKDDTISRQAVLKLLSTIPAEEAITKAMLIQSVKQMDAAQPSGPDNLVKDSQGLAKDLVNDTISRQAAIEAIKEDKIDLTNTNVVAVFKATGDFEKVETQVMTCDRHIEILKDLPSAQPEIVKCKDCKHYGCILHSGTQFEYGECFGHEESDYIFEVKPDDYCSRAERRTDE